MHSKKIDIVAKPGTVKLFALGIDVLQIEKKLTDYQGFFHGFFDITNKWICWRILEFKEKSLSLGQAFIWTFFCLWRMVDLPKI